MTGNTFGGGMAFVGGFVRKHGLADDVANRINVRYIGLQVLVDGDKPALIHIDPGFLRADQFTVRHPADGDQYAVKLTGFGGGIGAAKGYFNRLRLSGYGFHFGGQQHFKFAAGVFVIDRNQVFVGGGHQLVGKLYDRHFTAQGFVYSGHFQTDNAAANHQQARRYRTQLEGPS